MEKKNKVPLWKRVVVLCCILSILAILVLVPCSALSYDESYGGFNGNIRSDFTYVGLPFDLSVGGIVSTPYDEGDVGVNYNTYQVINDFVGIPYDPLYDSSPYYPTLIPDSRKMYDDWFTMRENSSTRLSILRNSIEFTDSDTSKYWWNRAPILESTYNSMSGNIAFVVSEYYNGRLTELQLREQLAMYEFGGDYLNGINYPFFTQYYLSTDSIISAYDMIHNGDYNNNSQGWYNTYLPTSLNVTAMVGGGFAAYNYDYDEYLFVPGEDTTFTCYANADFVIIDENGEVNTHTYNYIHEYPISDTLNTVVMYDTYFPLDPRRENDFSTRVAKAVSYGMQNVDYDRVFDNVLVEFEVNCQAIYEDYIESFMDEYGTFYPGADYSTSNCDVFIKDFGFSVLPTPIEDLSSDLSQNAFEIQGLNNNSYYYGGAYHSPIYEVSVSVNRATPNALAEAERPFYERIKYRTTEVVKFDDSFNFFSWIGSTIGSLLNVDLIGSFSLGDVLYTVLAVGFVVLVLKFFSGG